MIILGCDSGLAAFGYAVAELCDDGSLVWHDAGAWRTVPGVAVRKGDDVSARCVDLYRKLRDLAGMWRPRVLAVEALAFPGGRVKWSVISGLARARTLVDCLAVERRAMIYERNAQQVKSAALGRKVRSATKEEVIHAMQARDASLANLLANVQASGLEHAADAAACILATVPALERRAEVWE